MLLATTLPYALLCVGFGIPSAHGLIEVLIALVAFAWLIHGLALLTSLSRQAPGWRSGNGGAGRFPGHHRFPGWFCAS